MHGDPHGGRNEREGSRMAGGEVATTERTLDRFPRLARLHSELLTSKKET
jgi:hypothetical protein